MKVGRRGLLQMIMGGVAAKAVSEPEPVKPPEVKLAPVALPEVSMDVFPSSACIVVEPSTTMYDIWSRR